ncbi:MAG: hypothetical protein FWH05_06090 [Oscillospiraceae bacterium]|nr:hypothetical protein [Oscillospiraceae bacterium]
MAGIPQISSPAGGQKGYTSGNLPQKGEGGSPFDIIQIQKPLAVGQTADRHSQGQASLMTEQKEFLQMSVKIAKNPTLAVESLKQIVNSDLLTVAKINGYTELHGELNELMKSLFISPQDLVQEIMAQERDNTMFSGNGFFDLLREIAAGAKGYGAQDLENAIGNILKAINFSQSRDDILKALSSNLRFLSGYFAPNKGLSEDLQQLCNQWGEKGAEKNVENLKGETLYLLKNVSESLLSNERTQVLIPLIVHNMSRYNTNQKMLLEHFGSLISHIPGQSVKQALADEFEKFLNFLLPNKESSTPKEGTSQSVVPQNAQAQTPTGQAATGQEAQVQTATGQEGQATTGQNAQAQTPTAQEAQAATGQEAQTQTTTGQEAQAQTPTGQEAQAQAATGQEAQAQTATGQETQAATGQNAQVQTATGQEAQAQTPTGQEAQVQNAATQEAQSPPQQSSQTQSAPAQEAQTHSNQNAQETLNQGVNSAQGQELSSAQIKENAAAEFWHKVTDALQKPQQAETQDVVSKPESGSQKPDVATLFEFDTEKAQTAVRSYLLGKSDGKSAIADILIGMMEPYHSPALNEKIDEQIKQLDSINTVILYLNDVLRAMPEVSARQDIYEYFLEIINNMADKNELPLLDKPDGFETQVKKSPLEELINFVQKNIDHPAMKTINNYNASNLLQSLINAPGVFTPLSHYIIPVEFADTRAFGELWVSNDEDSQHDNFGNVKRGYHLFLTFDVETVGRFEIDLRSMGEAVNIALLHPEGFSEQIEPLVSKVGRVIASTGYVTKSFTTGPLIKPRNLTEVFPQILEKRAGFNVTA